MPYAIVKFVAWQQPQNVNNKELKLILHSDVVIKKFCILYDGLETRIHGGNENVINLDRFVNLLAAEIELQMGGNEKLLQERTVVRLAIGLAANMIYEQASRLTDVMRK